MPYLDRLQAEIAGAPPVAAVKIMSVPENGTHQLGETILVGPTGVLYPLTSTLLPGIKTAQEMLTQGRSGAIRVALPDGRPSGSMSSPIWRSQF